jgi:hypothetical protein
LLPDHDCILNARVAAIQVTAQEARDPWLEHGCRCPKLSAANLRTASSASARICSTHAGTEAPAASRPTPRPKGLSGRPRGLSCPALQDLRLEAAAPVPALCGLQLQSVKSGDRSDLASRSPCLTLELPHERPHLRGDGPRPVRAGSGLV